MAQEAHGNGDGDETRQDHKRDTEQAQLDVALFEGEREDLEAD
jgi:hypothetical protein